MRKITLIVLLCLFLFLCLAGCSIPNNANEDKGENRDKTADTDKSNQENEDYSVALNEFITKMQKEADNFEKIEFFVEYQELHYELKESGKYNDEKWTDAAIIVTVDCNYDLATNETWYKACSNTDVKTLNTALFNEYSHELSEGHFTPWGIAPALYFEYDHSESTLSETLNVFYSDYAVLEQLVNLEYVNRISIQYFYAVPGSYFDD